MYDSRTASDHERRGDKIHHSGEAPDVQVLETVHRNQNLLGAAANSTRQMMGKHC